MTTADRTTARAAGRGGVAVLGAKVFFILAGFVQQTLVRGAIGLAGTGALSRVLAVASVFNNVVVSSSIQGVSRAVAGAHDSKEEAFRATLRVHAPIALGLGVLFFVSAPWIAAFEGAEHITTPLRVMAGVIVIYGVYAPLIGSLNGRAMFTRQAALDVVAATLRTFGLLGMGYLFFSRGSSGVLGSTLGVLLAASCVLPLALRWTGIGKAAPLSSAEIPSPRIYLAMLVPLAVAQLFTNGVMQIDITLLGRFLSFGALHTGLAPSEATRSADEWVAVYRFSQFFAFLPYQLVFSITQILFPMVARAHAEGDRVAVRQYVERGARLGAIACGLLVTVVVTVPGSVLNFAYGHEVAERGASTLRVLAIGQGAFTLFGIANTVLASLGRERIAAVLSLVALFAVAGFCTVAAREAPYGEAQLQATALATSVALGLALVAATFVVRKAAGGFVPLKTAVRAGIGVSFGAVVGTHLPIFGKLMTPVVCLAIATSFVVYLVLARELTPADAAMVRALVGRNKT